MPFDFKKEYKEFYMPPKMRPGQPQDRGAPPDKAVGEVIWTEPKK